MLGVDKVDQRPGTPAKTLRHGARGQTEKFLGNSLGCAARWLAVAKTRNIVKMLRVVEGTRIFAEESARE